MQIYALKMFLIWDGFVISFVTNEAHRKNTI